jgi:hypothetical protein
MQLESSRQRFSERHSSRVAFLQHRFLAGPQIVEMKVIDKDRARESLNWNSSWNILKPGIEPPFGEILVLDSRTAINFRLMGERIWILGMPYREVLPPCHYISVYCSISHNVVIINSYYIHLHKHLPSSRIFAKCTSCFSNFNLGVHPTNVGNINSLDWFKGTS